MKTLTRQVFQSNTNTVLQTNTYDQAGRLTQVKHQVNGQAEVTLASMEYNELGQLKQKSLHGAVGSGIQNLNYAYNIRGWLEKINNPDVTPSSSSNQKLNLGLYYNSVPSGFSCQAQYNGNISSMVWNTPEQAGALSPGDKQGYGFTYDGLNRLLSSTYGEGAGFSSYSGANNENVTYDKNGNILTLVRYKKETGLIDDLTYTYVNNNASNILGNVNDAVEGENGFSENVNMDDEYIFDANGNLIWDANKGYTSILYNYMNLPRRVGTTSQYISYIYSADGNKLAKVGTNGVVTTYAGSFVYEGSSLKYIIHPEGMYLPGGNYQYYLKDHLGNTRLMVNTSGSGGTVVQQTDYYPFGMDIASYNGGVDNRYRYNGKELQTDEIGVKKLDWYDYGKRFYDPQLARFHSVDLLSDKYYFQSPYVYAVNNPLRFIDFMGMGPGDPPEFWHSFGNTLSTYFDNTMNGVVDRIYEPSLLVNDAANVANGIMTLASDVTGVSNLVGAENKTANALGGAINTVSELPSMSSGERGAVAASALIMVGEIALTKKMPLGEIKAVKTGAELEKFSVGAYNEIKGTVKGLDAHHVGQQALMKEFVPGYNASIAPSILVPKVGHTIKGPMGIISRNTTGLSNARQVVARDILELRRVYPDVPNSSLQELIQMNKTMYPSSLTK